LGGAPNVVQVIDQDGNIVETFISMKSCAEALGRNPNTLTKWVRTGHQFNCKNRLCTIKKL